MNFHRTANHIGGWKSRFFSCFYHLFINNSSPFYLKLLKLKDMTRKEEIQKQAEKKAFEPSRLMHPYAKQHKTMSAYEIGFIEGAVWADAHPDIDVRTMAAWQSGYKEAIDKACEWLTRELCYTARSNNFFNNKTVTDEFVEQFKQAMKGGKE